MTTTDRPTNPSADHDIVIVAAARTPQGRLKGQLASFTAVQLGALAIRGALTQASVAPDAVDAVIVGQVLAAGSGQNAARQAAIGAGIGWDVPAHSVNKVCLSGLTAIIDAARMIRTGDAVVVVAAGMESMTRAPHLLMGSRDGWTYGSVEVLDHLAYDGLTDAYDRESMGASTERHNARFDLTRRAQDEVAALSHQRAAAAQAAGVFDDEIVPVSVPQRRGEPLTVTADEGIRPDTTVETLGALRAAFAEGGSITAGNSSQISDGASAVVVTTRATADAHGWPVLATVGASGQTAGPDNSLQAQPARAIERACEKQGMAPSDLDFVEINEAFGAVVARSQTELGLSSDIVNIHGGGIAIGHPIGASGTRLVVHAVHELARRGSGNAAVGLCGGGGQGEALILTR
jgi:acetyl-CoA C-acetyltransferase